MTTRTAELLMALILALFSGYLMWKSAELDIGWISGEGPGGGAFPFWLSVMMLICCIWIIVNWARKVGDIATVATPYFAEGAVSLFLLGAGAITAMLGLIHIIGIYGAIPLFMIFYMKVIGAHRWLPTLAIAGLTPIAAFLFFEIALTITLPKGYAEPLFYPLYDLFM